MNKYKVGDVILVKAEITSVDNSEIPYRARTSRDTKWFTEGDVFALVSSASPSVEPEAPKAEGFKVGDWVTSELQSKRGVAQIFEIDNSGCPYHLRFSDGFTWWSSPQTTERAEEPKPAPVTFAVGDWVTSTEWTGKGQIIMINDDKDDDEPYRVKFETGCPRWCSADELTKVAAPVEEKPAETKRLTVGDYVIHVNHPEYGTGRIVEDDHGFIPYFVKWDNAVEGQWHFSRNLLRAEPPAPAKPEPKFKIGDRVRITGKTEMGTIKGSAHHEGRGYDLFLLDLDEGFWNKEHTLFQSCIVASPDNLTKI